MMTIPQAESRFGLPKGTVRRAVKRREIKTYRRPLAPNRIFVDPKEVEEMTRFVEGVPLD